MSLDTDYDDSYLADIDDFLEENDLGTDTPKKGKKKQAADKGPSVAKKVLELCESLYDLGCSMDREAFVVPKVGARVARVIAKGDTALRGELASVYEEQYGMVPGDQAVREAVQIVAHRSLKQDPTPLHLRVAANPDGPGIIIDLGDASGEAVIITPAGWTIAIPPVLFRRTRLTAALPRPVKNGDLGLLRSMLNVNDESWALVQAYLIGSLMPDIPRPVGFLGGEQGTGKSGATRMLARLIDPSPALTRTVPHDPENWVISASGSWMVALDNVSHIPEWLSDAICRASTGEAWVARARYTDNELNVLSFRRSILLNTIDCGSLRGDLADRMIMFELERISPTMRRTEAQLDAAFKLAWPSMLGGLYTLLAQVMAVLPSINLTDLGRMADFTMLVAAMDEVLGTNALELYRKQATTLASDVVAGDPVASELIRLMEKHDLWSGSATELWHRLERPNEVDRKSWPGNARALSAKLKRAAPSLAKIGIDVQDTRTSTGRSVVLTKLAHFSPDVHAVVVEATSPQDPF